MQISRNKYTIEMNDSEVYIFIDALRMAIRRQARMFSEYVENNDNIDDANSLKIEFYKNRKESRFYKMLKEMCNKFKNLNLSSMREIDISLKDSLGLPCEKE